MIKDPQVHNDHNYAEELGNSAITFNAWLFLVQINTYAFFVVKIFSYTEKENILREYNFTMKIFFRQ